MHTPPQIILHNINYSIPNSRVQIQDFSNSFTPKKYGIVGDNGSGKSTLMRLIVGEIFPQKGSVHLNCSISYCPQQFDAAPLCTVSEIMGVDRKLAALQKIEQGSDVLEYYETLGEDWGIAERVRKALDDAGLENVNHSTDFAHLSGGQKTKLLLAKTFISDTDFILLDEPTNNLDSHARKKLYDFIRRTSQGLIIISHDRELLDHMDEIVELSEKGISRFGGNYSHYIEQKALLSEALNRQLNDAKKSIQKSEKIIQETREKHEQKKSKGRKEFLRGDVDKLTANSRKGKSENTQARNATLEDRIISEARQKIEQVKNKIEIKVDLDIDLAATAVPNGKNVLTLEDISFNYPGSAHAIIHHFSLQILGPQRIALTGKNGSGKTTLVKLICGELKPSSGTINIGVPKIAYLDQKVAFLEPDHRLIDQFLKHNPDTSINDAYYALAQFAFRNKDAEKTVKHLSGGEKIRAGLAISLTATPAPQFIILDEPTNHLDLRSIQCIESALRQFKGAMMVISHDGKFLENVFIEREILI